MAVPAIVQAQQAATISGRVTTDGGQPLPAATVFIQTLGVGTTTRDDGTFSLSIRAGASLGRR
jgi:hypothetical protein